MNTHGEYVFGIRSYECGADGYCTFANICNYLQEAAGLNARDLGFSKDDFAAKGDELAWVLTRMRVKISRYPRWGESVKVVTFPRGGRKVIAYRDFIFRSDKGDELGRAASEWMIIDMKTRKLVAIPECVYAVANDEWPAAIGEPFAKLRWDCRDTASAIALKARRHDIDVNGHVNNVSYIRWLMESLPESAMKPIDFEIAFKSETMVGDEIFTESVEIEPGVHLARVAAPDGHDHVVARVISKAGA